MVLNGENADAEVQSIDELNDYCREWCLKETERKTVPYTKETVAQMWEKEMRDSGTRFLSQFKWNYIK